MKKSKGKFSLFAMVGLVGGIYFVIQGIMEAGQPHLFWNPPSFLIIVGGTVAAMVLSYPIHELAMLPSFIKQVFVSQKFDLAQDIGTMVGLCSIARKNGLLALEAEAEKISDPFLNKAIKLLTDNLSRENLEERLIKDIIQTSKRHKLGAGMLSKIAGLAPSLGLVGTYVGLIPMLTSIKDPDALGPLMAIELVSSFYGGFIANVVFSPMAKRLENKSRAEKNRNELIAEGILGIYDGKNLRVLEEML